MAVMTDEVDEVRAPRIAYFVVPVNDACLDRCHAWKLREEWRGWCFAPPRTTSHNCPLLQVNIAQFHPFPGVGLVYGTKRGRVRVFRRGDCAAAVENGCK